LLYAHRRSLELQTLTRPVRAGEAALPSTCT
jgi:hypothetical protein